MSNPPPLSTLFTRSRFALHVFRTAGAAENGGMTVFTDMQELVAVDGLDTHASGNSLWVTAARAGIVDVDRWVVAAVLWQAADAVEKTVRGRTDQERLPSGEKSTGAVAFEEEDRESNGTALETLAPGDSCAEAVVLQSGASCASAGGRHIGEVVRSKDDGTGAASVDELIVVSAEAASLWEELRREAFRSVLGNNRNVHQIRSSEDSYAFSAVHSTSQRERKREARAVPADTRVLESVVSTGNSPLQQIYGASRSIPSSFDHALIQTLAIAGRCASGAVAGTTGVVPTTAAMPDAGSSTAAETSARCTDIEKVLLVTYAVAGFADGSGLELADIVEAVKVRRQRAAIGRRTVEPSLRGTGDRSTGSGSASPPEATRTLPESRRDKEKSPREGSAVYELGAKTTDGNGEGSSAGNTSGESEMQLVGIPPELRELFRAAALAGIARKQQQEQRQEQQVEEGGRAVMHVCKLAWSCALPDPLNTLHNQRRGLR